MKRLLWLGVGLAVGALVVRKATQKAQSFTPGGIAASVSESAGGMADAVRSFVADVRDGMAEREQQIHEAFAEGIAIDDDVPLHDDDATMWGDDAAVWGGHAALDDDERRAGTNPNHPQEGIR